jgi:Tfp pilus assembly PilM family ATPase
MNKREKIQFYKQQLESSRQLMAVAQQNYNLATRLESEAKRALDMLGDNPEPTRKGTQLSDALKTTLLGNLTKH